MILYRFPFTLSVVLSVRSSDRIGLDRVVEGLKQQTLPKRHWRLIVVDERDRPREDLAALFTWHPRVNLVRNTAETEGPAPAAIRAMLGARTDLVAFIDGRAVLDTGYLAEAIRLAEEQPFVGIFGGHTTIADGSPNPGWQRTFLRLFGLRQVTEETILVEGVRRHMPGPSAYIVRREHLRRFSHILRRHPFFQDPDFAPSRDDFDFRAGLARTVVQTGYSMGLFPTLKSSRITTATDFQERSVQEHLRRDAFSRVLERFVWTGLLPEAPAPTRWEKFTLRWMRTWQFGRISRLRIAHRTGVVDAYELATAHCARPAVAPSLVPHGSPFRQSSQAGV